MASSQQAATIRPSQIDEEDDNPLFTTTVEPLSTSNVKYTPESVIPGSSLQRWTRTNDWFPLDVLAFWHVLTNVERLGLGTPFLHPTLHQALVGFQPVFRKYADPPEQEPMAWTILMAWVMANFAIPLRRQLPQNFVRVMRGGKEGWKEVEAYPMFEFMDLLKRELGIRNRPAVLQSGNRAMAFSGFAEKNGLEMFAHERHCMDLIVRTNLGRRGRPCRFFPNHREHVIACYAKPWEDIRTDVELGPHVERTFSMRIGDAFVSSGVALKDLQRIELDKMLCHQQHKGRYLLCRVLTGPRLGLGIALAVEDPNGQAITLAIENLKQHEAFHYPVEYFAGRFPVGAMLAIKEPSVCLGRTTGIAEIRVSVPTDIERIPSSDVTWRFDSPCDRTMAAAAIREKGNKLVLDAKYEEAKEMYLMALNAPATELTKSLEIAIRLNLALTRLALGEPGPALAECMHLEEYIDALSTAQQQKLYHRKLQAAYQLQLWSTAEIALVQCKSVKLDIGKWSTYERDLQQRWKEVRGDFEWRGLMRGARDSLQLPCSNFYGPLEVRTVPMKGRGMFVSRDVKAGELLLVERKIFTSHRHPHGRVMVQDASNPQVAARLSSNSAGAGIQAFVADHSRLSVMDALTPGETRWSPMMSEEERLAAIRAPLGPINVDDLHRKQVANSFGSPEAGAAVFASSSLLNHSCLPTAAHVTYANTEMVWARNDLAAGTELTFSYVDPDRSHASRAASLQTVWNFKCDCGSCLDDREEDDAERDRLMTVEWPKVVAATAGKSDVVIGASQKALLPAFFDGEMGDTYRLAGQDVQMPEISGWKEANAMYRLFCEKLEKTYRQDRTAPKTALATVYTETQDCFDTNYPRGTRSAVDGYRALLQIQGAVFSTPAEQRKTGRKISVLPANGTDDSTVKPMMRISMIVSVAGKVAEASAWRRTAFWAYKAINGPYSFEALFRQRYNFELRGQTNAKLE